MLVVTSPAFVQGQPIPRKYTGEGADVSPAVAWSGAPAGTKEYAIVMVDPDAPSPKRPAPEPWVHWVLYGIPPEASALAEGTRGVGVGGVNSWDVDDPEHDRYAGPMPPPGSGAHRYVLTVYALDAKVALAPGATRRQLIAAMKGHVAAQGELVGAYERRR